MKTKLQKQAFRKLRVQRTVIGTPTRPRLNVVRSLKHIYAQVIDDVQGQTLAAASSNHKAFEKTTGIKSATRVGEDLAKKAIAKGVDTVVFDRNGKSYHGRVKALAEGARQGGLKF